MQYEVLMYYASPKPNQKFSISKDKITVLSSLNKVGSKLRKNKKENVVEIFVCFKVFTHKTG